MSLRRLIDWEAAGTPEEQRVALLETRISAGVIQFHLVLRFVSGGGATKVNNSLNCEPGNDPDTVFDALVTQCLAGFEAIIAVKPECLTGSQSGIYKGHPRSDL